MNRSLLAIALLLPLLSLDGQVIRGRVVDADARPVAGARVQVVLADRSLLDFASDETVATSDDGRYEVPVPPFEEAARAAVAVTLPAHATVRSAPFTIGGGGLRIDVTLPRFEAVIVRVADRAGKPMPKARVAFAPTRETAALDGPEALLREQFESLTTRTDDSGEAVLRLLPGVWDFAAVADGFQPTTLPERTVKRATTMTVVLERAFSIRGRVHRQGTGVEGALVSLLDESRRSQTRDPVFTDEEGAFEIPGLAAGKYRLRIANTWELLEETVEAKAPSTIDIKLPPAGALRMHVIDGDTRKPVLEFEYAIEPVDAPKTVESVQRHRTMATKDGILTMNVSAGPYHVSATADGYTRKKPVVVQVSEREPAEVTIELDRGAIFTGRVSDENDASVAGAEVSVRRANPEEWRTAPGIARTDADGAFTVSGVDAGPVNVFVHMNGFVPFRKAAEAETGTTEVTVRLTRGLKIEGTVQRGGKPVAGVQVSAITAGLGGVEQPAVTDAQGKFVLTGLIAARYAVTATLGSESTGIDDVDPTRAGPLVLSFDSSPTGVLYGVVSGVPSTLGGKITRRVVIVRSEKRSAEGIIDEAGNYRIEDAPAGQVFVGAQLDSASGSRSLGKRVEVIAGQELRVDLELGAYPVRGRVLHNGKPAADVTLYFNSASGGFATATSRADGAYEVVLPAAGMYRINVSTGLVENGNFQLSREVRGGDTIDIELREQVVEGTVVDAATRQPLKGIVMVLVATAIGQSFAGEASTDANGHFRIVTTGSGSHLIIARGPGYVHRSQSLQLSGTGQTQVALELPKAEPLRVRVIDAGTGTPLRARVIAASPDGSLLPLECPEDADGISYVCWVTAGQYHLTVAVPGYADREVEVTAPGTMDVAMR